MKELDLELLGKGQTNKFSYKQIHASKYAFVYEASDKYGNNHFEVFERKERQKSETVVQGKEVRFIAKVLYPKAEDLCLGIVL